MTCSRCIHKNICKIINRISLIEYDNHNCANFFELVRCKDCKYSEKPFNSNRRDYCEKRSTVEHTEYVNPTDYCSKGKRREIE